MGAVRSKTLVERMGFNDPDLLSPMHDSIVLWIGDHVQEYIARTYDPWRQSARYIERAKGKIENALNEADEEIKRNTSAAEAFLARRQSEEYDSLYFKCELKSFQEKADRLTKRRQELSEWLDAPISQPPAPPFPKYESKFEVPVVSGRDFIIGFVDVVTTVHSQSLRLPDSYEPHLRPAQAPALLFTDDEPWNIYFEAKTTIPSLGELLRQIRAYQQYVQGRFVVVSPDTRFQRHIESQGVEFWECVL